MMCNNLSIPKNPHDDNLASQEAPRHPLAMDSPDAVPLTPGAKASGASVWRVLYWRSASPAADCLDNTTTDDIEAPDKASCERYVQDKNGEFINAWRVE